MLAINDIYSSQDNISGFQFNEETKNVLLNVADILIPLQTWIDSKSYSSNNTSDILV